MKANLAIRSLAAIPAISESSAQNDSTTANANAVGSSAICDGGLRVTRHAAARMAQRGFRVDDLAIIEMIGIAVADGYFVREKECREFERNMRQMLGRVRKLVGMRIVVADNRIVTTYHTHKATERGLLRGVADRELVSVG